MGTIIDANHLPCPRFEFRWRKLSDSWYSRECVYSLVLPLRELDIRSTDTEGNPRELSLEIGSTEVTGGNGDPPVSQDGKVDTPYRDGAHAQWDCDSLGGHIPIVAVCEDHAMLVQKQPIQS